jgi:hypothetical protein
LLRWCKVKINNERGNEYFDKTIKELVPTSEGMRPVARPIANNVSIRALRAGTSDGAPQYAAHAVEPKPSKRTALMPSASANRRADALVGHLKNVVIAANTSKSEF